MEINEKCQFSTFLHVVFCSIYCQSDTFLCSSWMQWPIRLVSAEMLSLCCLCACEFSLIINNRMLKQYKSRCFHTSTFGAHLGSIDVRVRFVWMMWTLSSELRCTPGNCTQALKKGGLGYSSCVLRCALLLMWMQSYQSWKWTAVNEIIW